MSEIKENIPCTAFKEAQDAGGIKKEPSFTIGGIEYYTFEKDLQNISANRFLLYQQDLATRQDFGMSEAIVKDYLEEVNEHNEKALKAFYNDDMDMLKKAIQDQQNTISIIKEHRLNTNLVAIMLEFGATCFIAPCESPYVVDFEFHSRKMLDWGQYIATEEGESFLPFFWKLSSNGEQNWIPLLVQSMSHLAKSPEEMTESELIRSEKSEYILAWEILNHKSHLEDLIKQKSLSKPARAYRTMLSLLKKKLNKRAYSIISNTAS